MDTTNDIRLRLRFYKDVETSIDQVREKFIEYKKKLPSDYFMKIRGNYIQFTIVGDKQHYWSPCLTLELEEKENCNGSSTHIRGLFGPAQTLWTFFIFLHFFMAGIFIVFIMFAISNLMLHKPISNHLIIMGLVAISWVLIYFIARQTRENGYPQMDELEKEFLNALES